MREDLLQSPGSRLIYDVTDREIRRGILLHEHNAKENNIDSLKVWRRKGNQCSLSLIRASPLRRRIQQERPVSSTELVLGHAAAGVFPGTLPG